MFGEFAERVVSSLKSVYKTKQQCLLHVHFRMEQTNFEMLWDIDIPASAPPDQRNIVLPADSTGERGDAESLTRLQSTSKLLLQHHKYCERQLPGGGLHRTLRINFCTVSTINTSFSPKVRMFFQWRRVALALHLRRKHHVHPMCLSTWISSIWFQMCRLAASSGFDWGCIICRSVCKALSNMISSRDAMPYGHSDLRIWSANTPHKEWETSLP